jgi:hypothetical protein
MPYTTVARSSNNDIIEWIKGKSYASFYISDARIHDIILAAISTDTYLLARYVYGVWTPGDDSNHPWDMQKVVEIINHLKLIHDSEDLDQVTMLDTIWALTRKWA